MRLFTIGILLLFNPFFASSSPETIALTRGPYLQMARPTSMMVVWNTNVSAEGTVRYGRYPGPNWEFLQTSPSSTLHAIELNNLTPDTLYYYEIQSGGTVLASGSDYSFTTYPLSGNAKPFRFAAFGDSGNGSQKQAEMVSQMKALRPQPELTLGLGDLVYSNGEWENYDPRYFGPNADILRSQVLWPSMGNHDSYTENGAPYLANFYLPTDSGAPGAPSNTELYYSFDYGEAHFVAIDSQISSKSIGGAMHDWLRADLADADARGMRWKVIFAHHPPYTYGTHNSDYELDLVFLRQNFTPLMDEFNVDLFLAGHSHVYERSYLVQDNAILQTHMNEYSKVTNPEGTMYIVSGAAAKDGSGALNHPLMSYSKGDVIGASVFDVTHDEIRGYFLQRDGRAVDLFTLRKGVDVIPPTVRDLYAPSGRELHVVFQEPVGGSSAIDLSHYYISDGVSVEGATLLTDGRTVVLSTTEQQLEKVYTVSVNGVQDREVTPNTITSAVKVSYKVEPVTGVARSDSWTFWEGTTFPGSGWNSLSYVDYGWQRGVAGLGYGDGDDTTFLENMKGNYLSVYARRFFSVGDLSTVTGMRMKIRYDDGFVAYLNGTEIARKNVPLGQDEMTMAVPDHEAGDFEVIDLSGYTSLLVEGTNLLAIEGHNATLFSSDFSLHPILEIDGGEVVSVPTPMSISEAPLPPAGGGGCFGGGRDTFGGGMAVPFAFFLLLLAGRSFSRRRIKGQE